MVLNQLRSESLFTGEFVWARKESSHQRRIHAKAVEKSPPTPRASQLLSHHCDVVMMKKRQVVVPRKPKMCFPPFEHCQRNLWFDLNQCQNRIQHQHQVSFTSTSIPLKYFLSKTYVAKRCSHWYKWTSSCPVMTFSAPGGKFPYWGISFVRTIITSQSPPHSRPTSAYLRKECEQGVSGNSKVLRWQDIP